MRKKAKVANEKCYIYVLSIVLLICTIPYLFTGYFGDDILNSATRGLAINNGMTLWETLLWLWKRTYQTGRIFFLAVMIQVIIFWVIQNLILYKAFIIFVTIVSMWVAKKWIVEICPSIEPNAVYLILLSCFPLCLTGDNVLLLYWGFCQIVITLSLLASLFLNRYLSKGKNKYLICSAIIMLGGYLMYELSYLNLFLLIGLIAICNKEQQRNFEKRRAAFLHICLFVIVIIINMQARSYAQKTRINGEYDGVKLAGSMDGFVKAFSIHFLSPIPFVNAFLKEQMTAHIFYAILCAIILCLAICTAIIIVRKNKHRAFLILSGFMWWAGSAFLLASTVKYQRELPVSGNPHIPIYTEYIGMCMVICGIGSIIEENMRRRISDDQKLIKWRRVVFGFCTIVGLTYCLVGERRLIQFYSDTKDLYVRMPNVYTEAIEQGLFDIIDDENVIIIDNRYSPTIFPDYFAQKARRKIKAERIDLYLLNMDKYNLQAVNGKIFPEATYITKSFITDQQEVVYLDKVDWIEINESGELGDIQTSEINYYLNTNDQSYIGAKEGIYNYAEYALIP